MIEIIPALDIIAGQVVRLVEGDFARETRYSDDPLALAKTYAAQGYRRLHLVDLDGARHGQPVHLDLVTRITQECGLVVDFGGGLRDRASIAAALLAGAAQVNIGSAALRNPELVDAALAEHGPDTLILAADARDGRVAAAGWREQTDVRLPDIIARFHGKGLRWALVTDIARDGTLSGPSLPLYAELLAAFPTLGLIASGGVANFADITALDTLGVPRVVVGKALLEGRITTAEVFGHAG